MIPGAFFSGAENAGIVEYIGDDGLEEMHVFLGLGWFDQGSWAWAHFIAEWGTRGIFQVINGAGFGKAKSASTQNLKITRPSQQWFVHMQTRRPPTIICGTMNDIVEVPSCRLGLCRSGGNAMDAAFPRTLAVAGWLRLSALYGGSMPAWEAHTRDTCLTDDDIPESSSFVLHPSFPCFFILSVQGERRFYLGGVVDDLFLSTVSDFCQPSIGVF